MAFLHFEINLDKEDRFCKCKNWCCLEFFVTHLWPFLCCWCLLVCVWRFFTLWDKAIFCTLLQIFWRTIDLSANWHLRSNSWVFDYLMRITIMRRMTMSENIQKNWQRNADGLDKTDVPCTQLEIAPFLRDFFAYIPLIAISLDKVWLSSNQRWHA